MENNFDDILNKCCKDNMIQWDLTKFKNDYLALYTSIIKAMQTVETNNKNTCNIISKTDSINNEFNFHRHWNEDNYDDGSIIKHFED